MYLTIRWLMGAYLPQIDRNYWWPVWLLSGPVCQRIGAAPPGVSLVPLSSLSSLKEMGIAWYWIYQTWNPLSTVGIDIWFLGYCVYPVSLLENYRYLNVYTWMTIKSRKSLSRKWLPDRNLKETYACSCSCTVFFPSDFVNITVYRIQKRHMYLNQILKSLKQPNATSSWYTSLLPKNKNIFHIPVRKKVFPM